MTLSKDDTNVLKGIAIVAMLFHHMYCSIPDWVEPYNGVLYWLGELGKVCVSIFLFCSGYGMSVQYRGVCGVKDTIKFLIKRFASFYINYWIIFLVFVPITVFLFNRPLNAAYGENVNIIKRLVYDLFGLQGINSYNITWWFNKLLILLYILFPFIFLCVKKSGIITLLLSLAICRFWMVLVGYDYYGGLYIYQLSFVLGIVWNKWEKTDVLSLYKKHGCPIIFKNRIILILVVLLFLALMVVFRMYPIIPKWTSLRMDAFISIGLSLSVVIVFRYSKVIKQLFVFFGKHSANIYLIHTFYICYWHMFWLHNGFIMRSGLNILVLMVMCVLSSLVLEYFKNKIGVYKLLSLVKNKLS